MVDTCAAEFPAHTPYYYSTFEEENESVASDKKKIIVLGSGPNRIGQGIEFDYSCVHGLLAAKEAGYEVKVGKFPLSASGKASASGHTEGFVKVIFDAKYGEWLGTHMIGYNVTEMIAETVVARKLETTYHEVLNSIHPHPTISESIKDAIEVAYDEAIHL